MAEILGTGSADSTLKWLQIALRKYEQAHPGAEGSLFRSNPASVRVRVVDPGFCGLEREDRHDRVWRFLKDLDEEVLSELSQLVLITKEGFSDSIANAHLEQDISAAS